MLEVAMFFMLEFFHFHHEIILLLSVNCRSNGKEFRQETNSTWFIQPLA
jgi:hypothetical protein